MKSFAFFVYGTLKQGHHNYRHIIEPSVLAEKTRKLGRYVTKNHYQLTNCGFPYMIDTDDKENTLPVIGEVFVSEDEEVLRRMDILEGVGTGFYRREKIPCVGGDGKTIEVFAYIADNDHAKNYPLCPVEGDDNKYYEWS